MSYALESKEWLEFEIINDVDRIMVLIVEMWHSDDDGTLAVKDTISLAARSTTLLPIPIGFPLFDPVLPEVVLSSVLKLPAADSIRVNRLRYLQTPKDVVTVPTVGELSFCAGAIGSLGLGSEWHKNAEGISDNADRLMGSEPSSLTFRFDNSVITDCLVLSFALQTSTHAEHPPSTLPTKGIGIMMSINSQFVEAQLDDGGNCEVMTYGASEIVLDGWHSCPPGLQLRLKTVRRSPSLLY